jgi:hypothetical protein
MTNKKMAHTFEIDTYDKLERFVDDLIVKSEKFYKKKTAEELSQELIETLKGIQTMLEEFSFKMALMVSGFRRYLEYQEEFKKFMREKKHDE